MADNVYNLKFTLSNGDVIDAGQITAPQGPKGDKGDSATIDANTLIALLSGGNGIEVVKNATGDKVELKIPDKILISNSLGTAQLSPQTISLFFNSENVGFLIDAIAGGMYKTNGSEQQWYLHQGNVKTLFGNQQSIYGSGNIDLYKHNVIISQGSTESERMCVYCQILSSNNLNINSLTAFQTIVKDDNEFIPATGKLKLYSGDTGSVIGGVCKAGAIEYNMRGKYTTSIDFSSGWATINAVVSGGLTFHDTVTTV